MLKSLIVGTQSNEYPQSMFWTRNKKNRYTPANPTYSITRWGLRGYTFNNGFHGRVFLMIVKLICLTDVNIFVQCSSPVGMKPIKSKTLL